MVNDIETRAHELNDQGYTITTIAATLGVTRFEVRCALRGPRHPEDDLSLAAPTNGNGAYTPVPPRDRESAPRREQRAQTPRRVTLATVAVEVEHGTTRGYWQHYNKAGTPPCDECKEAYNATRRTGVGQHHGKGGPKPKPREHGTRRGYQQHYHNREKACDDCRFAYNLSEKERTAARSEQANEARRQRKARAAS